MTDIKLNVFGRDMLVRRSQGKWLAYYLGNVGKRRLAEDITIPSDIKDHEIPGYMADFYHEWATPAHHGVLVLD